MFVFTLFLMNIYMSQPDFEVVRTLDVPNDENYFLQNPLSFDLDTEGNLYLVDGEAKVIFIWDSKGQFVKTMGKPGQGPGEFSFSGRGPANGFVFTLKDQIFVFDGGQRKLSIFGKDGHFLNSPNLLLPRSRIQEFFVLDENQFVLSQRQFADDHIEAQVKSIGTDGKVVKTYFSQKDDTISFKMENGRPANMTFRAYNPSVMAGYNANTGKIYIGFSGEPSVEIVSKDGEDHRVNLPIVQRDVKELDKDEFNEARDSGGFQRRRPVKFVFPEKMPYFGKIFALDSNRFFLFHETPFTHTIDGNIFDEDGQNLGAVHRTLGEGGGLLNARGLILQYKLNEDDEFEISLLKVVTKGS